MKLHWNKTGALTPRERIGRVQFACLLAVLLMELAFFLLEDRASGVAYLLAERYMALPAMAFLGASLCRELPRKDRLPLYAGLAVITLFFCIQVLHQVLESEAKQVGTFLCAYALCLPFAASAEDARRQRGLKWMAALHLAVGVLLTAYTALLLAGTLPACLMDHVKWDGGRLYAMGHPNICATLLMISVALSLGLAAACRKRWVRITLAVLAVPQFAALSLTNGRTTMILTCLLLGGLAFCALRGRGWKRFALALLAAVVVIAATFGASRAVYSWNQTRLVNSAAAAQTASETETGTGNETGTEAETEAAIETETEPAQTSQVLVAEQYQGTLANDFKTLNGRTEIWKSALAGLEENPRVKFIGTEYVEMILTRYAPLPVYHTHNSWLEALYRMGLPGLAAALVITAMTVWSAAVVLWRNNDLWKSCVALLALCLLGCAMLEPYLFVVDISYFYLDFLFLMCLGYLWQWRGEKV
ncbi:MAG: O-antigen ligase family protein [Eubacteriales bacterium]|nr:O-antigen ligase family protein [Eubacteriales bacterium]